MSFANLKNLVNLGEMDSVSSDKGLCFFHNKEKSFLVFIDKRAVFKNKIEKYHIAEAFSKQSMILSKLLLQTNNRN